MEGYTRKQISKFLKMPERAINYYTERKVVVPEIDEGGGRGTVRRYSEKNIVELAIIKQLTGYGVAFNIVENIFNLLRCPVPKRDETGELSGLDMSGFIGHWKEFKPNTYLVLYQMDDGEIKIEMPLGHSAENILNKDRIKDSWSVLIITVGRIVSMVKDL